MSALAGFAFRHLSTSPWTAASNSHRTQKSRQMAATFGHDRPELDLKGWPGGERLYQEATAVQMHIKLERLQRDNVKTQIKFRQDFWLSCMDNSCIIFTLNDYDQKMYSYGFRVWPQAKTRSVNLKKDSACSVSSFLCLSYEANVHIHSAAVFFDLHNFWIINPCLN